MRDVEFTETALDTVPRSEIQFIGQVPTQQSLFGVCGLLARLQTGDRLLPSPAQLLSQSTSAMPTPF